MSVFSAQIFLKNYIGHFEKFYLKKGTWNPEESVFS